MRSTARLSHAVCSRCVGTLVLAQLPQFATIFADFLGPG
jgi:hypothetical protein